MFISVSKDSGGRYFFAAGDSPADDQKAMFRSDRDFHLVGGLPSTYASFGEAHAYASRLVEKYPSCVLAKKSCHYKRGSEGPESSLSPEDDIVFHYNEQMELIQNRVEILDSEDEDDRRKSIDAIATELDGIAEEITSVKGLVEKDDNLETLLDIESEIAGLKLRLAEKVRGLPKKKVASTGANPLRFKDFIRAFSEAAMSSVAVSHPYAYVKGAAFLPEKGCYEATIAEANERRSRDLLFLRFSGDMLLEGIIPSTELWKECPCHSEEFRRKYWEPIVYAVGHVCLPEAGTVVVPAMAKKSSSGTFQLPSVAPTQIKEGDEVMCVRPDLETYYGRTGEVESKADWHDHSDLVVNFRRGLGTVTLTDKDVEKVTLPS
jgi:hypothetical protein